jgi:hypothetical protein
MVFHARFLTLVAQLGGEPSAADGMFNRPQGLAARDGLLAVCDSGNSRLQLFEAASLDPACLTLQFVRVIGRHGLAPGRFVEPRGVGILGARRDGQRRLSSWRSRAAHRAGRAAAGARTRGLTARGAWGACVAPQTGSTRTVGCGRRELWCRGVRRELDLKRAPCVGRARLGAGARQRTAIRVDVPYACRYSVTL